MKLTMIVIAVLALSGCGENTDNTGETKTERKYAQHCTPDTVEKRAQFILQCIANANPHSDEEPEGWIRRCQWMAEGTYCPNRTMLITYEGIGRFRRTISMEPVE